MAQSHSSPPTRKKRPTGKKALRRVERLQVAYAKTDGRVRALRERLARAEKKLARRMARLAEARAIVEPPVAALDAESPDAREPEPEPNGARQPQVADAGGDHDVAPRKRRSGSKNAAATKG